MVESRFHGILVQPLFFASLGIFFSFWNIVDPDSVPCISSGCNLYHSASFGGVTFWWLGLFGFGVLTILSIMGVAKLGWICAAVGLSFDILLFVIMAMTRPCMVCLCVGLLLALSYMSFRKASFPPLLGSEKLIARRSFLLLIWSFLFLVNLVFLIQGFISPWALNVGDKSRDATISIYFSPSCEACKKLVLNLPEAEVQKSAWYPIMEKSEDLSVIAKLEQILRNRKISFAEAFSTALTSAPSLGLHMFSFDNIVLQLRLWVNKAHVLATGDGRMPLLEFRGVPAILLPKVNPEVKQQPMSNDEHVIDATLPLEFDGVGMCGGSGNDAKPCIE